MAVQTVYGQAQIRGVIGTASISGLTNATWDILNIEGSPEGDVADQADGVGDIVASSVEKAVRKCTVTCMIKGSANQAQALAANLIPDLMTIVTLAGTGTLPAWALNDSGKWNLISCSNPLGSGEYAKITLGLRQVRQGGNYVSLAAATPS